MTRATRARRTARRTVIGAMAILRVPNGLRTIAFATSASPWREPGVLRWWAFVHDDSRDETPSRPATADRDGQMSQTTTQ